MKVLFVGDGNHDIGPPIGNLPPRPARGVVPALARRICNGIREDSLAMSCPEVSRYNVREFKLTKRDLLGRGYTFQVKVAVVLSSRKFGCDGTICVVDRDTDAERGARLAEAKTAARELDSDHRLAIGEAVHSIEAWTLGDPDALAAELGIARETLEYKAADVEGMKETSAKPERHPKALLSRLSETVHREDSVSFRESVASRTDLNRLARNCSEGFAKFAEDVRVEFCPYREKI